jgi:hypothetical protein
VTFNLLQVIASTLEANVTQRSEIVAVLDNPEALGRHLKDAVILFWEREHGTKSLTTGLDEQDASLVLRLLVIVAKE